MIIGWGMSKERELLKRWLIDFGKIHPDVELMKDTQTLLAQPEQEQEQEQESWIKTNGKEPSDWEDYEYVWTHWKSGRICLDEAWGCFMWEEITHWMPASIKEPSKPS